MIPRPLILLGLLIVIAGCSSAQPGSSQPGVSLEGADTLYQQAVQSSRQDRTDAAIDLLEQALRDTPEHHDSLQLLAELLEQKAMPLSLDGRWDLARPLLVRAADLGRRLLRLEDGSDHDHRPLVASLLYNETCAYSRTGEPDRALASLRECLETGFLGLSPRDGPTPRELLLADPDLDAIRSQPEFHALKTQYLPDQSATPAADR